MNARFIPGFFIAAILPAGLLAGLLAGCRSEEPPPTPVLSSPHDEAVAANQIFLGQKTFDPWVLTTDDPGNPIPFYACNGQVSYLLSPSGEAVGGFRAGAYSGGQLAPLTRLNLRGANDYGVIKSTKTMAHLQQIDLRRGELLTRDTQGNDVIDRSLNSRIKRPWAQLWQTSDIVIDGDPEAQQVTHANLFYLLSSTYPGSRDSIPPMGLSSNTYGGHIFWDAEVWMLPALLVQHPESARAILEYRVKTLRQAEKNAEAHGFAGAEYAWESAETGAEMAPPEFAQERHITADVGWAAWQFYLWTGDKTYLKTEGWPVLSATAAYWVSRVTTGTDGQYHILKVLSPDETAGVVNDDAYTNGVVQANLRAASAAAKILGQPADPRWAVIADHLHFPFDKARGIPAENDAPMTDRFAAKQADTLLLLHPLHAEFDPVTVGKMLDFYAAHTIKNGPAMTASMQAIVAAQLGRGPESLRQFHDSYRPFLRGPWDAFAEKQTSNRVYFCTGMGGCLQSVLYGFAGLQAVEAGRKARGTRIAGDSEAALYADPHLPPGWKSLTIKGVRFRGRGYDVAVASGNRVMVHPL